MIDSHSKWLQTRKPINIEINIKKRKLLGKNFDPWGITKIPPLNSDVRFSKAKLKQVNRVKLQSFAKVQPPLEFKNYDPDSKDHRMKIASTPMNQYGCGSCYAITIAEVASDGFVYKQGLSFNPDLSPLALMACAKDPSNGGCDIGGVPAQLARFISKDDGRGIGILSNKCMNYKEAWKKCCSKSNNPDGLVPKICGCCVGTEGNENKHYKYFIKNVSFIVKKNKNDEISVNYIKQHIMNYGSAITGFLVYFNFLEGDFSETKNVYIKSATYNGKPPGREMGGHAVSIVGWGVEPSITLNGKVIKNVSYWWVRNTWGTDWGIKMNNMGGYCKYAMADYDNDINTDVALEQDNDGYGGVILFEPDDDIELSNYDSEVKGKSNFKIFFYILLFVIIVVIVIVIIKLGPTHILKCVCVGPKNFFRKKS
jgi:hypothetical protein